MLRVIPPQKKQQSLFNKVHAGMFCAHLSDTKVHSELSRHYWCQGMWVDIMQWTRGCLGCNSHSLGRAVHASCH